MTKLLEQILERASRWPREAQEELVRSVLDIEERFSVYHLSEAEREGVRVGVAEARAGKLAPDKEVEAVFNRYRRS